MTYESPAALLARLRIGREEYVQRLLTMLIVGGAYPRWNTANSISLRGRVFLTYLDAASFGASTRWNEPAVFIDELDLPRRHDGERGGAPDWAVLWEKRLWLIELKTERGSHRPDQIPSYFELGRHHHGDRAIDLTYLTPRFPYEFEASAPWARYAHVTWDEVAELVQRTWSDDVTDAERELADAVLDTLERLAETPAQWRTRLAAPQAPEPADLVDAAVALADRTAADGRQRALDAELPSLDALLDLRLAVREVLCAGPPGDDRRRVLPWIWQPQSTGAPLTTAGALTGYELRLSRYTDPVC